MTIDFKEVISLSATIVVALACSTLAGAAAQGTIVWTDHASPFKGTNAMVPGGWTKGDDSSFSVDLFGPDYNKQTGNGGRMILFADPRATAGGQKPTNLTSVGTAPAALVAWLRHNPKLAVSAPTARTIAGNLKAISVDMHVRPTAGKEDPSCTNACWTYLTFRTGCCYGTDTVTYERIYFATVGGGTNAHVLMISVEGRPRTAWIKVLPTAKTIIDALVVPRK
ncbi:MAG: hypothetical protein ACJ76I_12305 [Gaiellaceae bacterium]